MADGLLAGVEDMMVPKQKAFEMFRFWCLCTIFGARRLIRDVGGRRKGEISRIILELNMRLLPICNVAILSKIYAILQIERARVRQRGGNQQWSGGGDR